VDADTLLDALVAFSWYQRWSKHRVDVAERTVTVALKMNKERHLAEALFCLGCIFKEIGRYTDAMRHLEEALKVFGTLADGPDMLRASECALEVLQTHEYMATPSDVLEDILPKVQAHLDESGSEYGVALGLLGRGRVYFYSTLHHDNEALQYLDAAKTALEGLHRPVCRVITIGPRCPRLLYLYFILRCSTGACIIRCSFISVCVRRAHLIFYSKLRCEHNHLYLLLCCLLTSYVVLLTGIATTEHIYLLLEAEISTYSCPQISTGYRAPTDHVRHCYYLELAVLVYHP
jgi:tetratricopeptide (TPR) repeat protein